MTLGGSWIRLLRQCFSGASFTAEHRQLKEEVSAPSRRFSPFFPTGGLSSLSEKYKKLSVSSGVRGVYSVDDIDFVFAQGRIKTVRFKVAGQW